MKKASLVIITLTLIFCGFALGFFLGRGSAAGSIRFSTVPTPTAAEAPQSTEASTDPTTKFPIDINTATAEDFTDLPGIGETLAQRIISYRNDHGPFENLADLLNVEGIGEKKLEDILDYIAIGGHA